MSARHKALGATVYTLDANDHFPDFISMAFGVDIATENAKGGASAYAEHIGVKRSSSHSFEIFQVDSTPKRLPSFSATLMSLGGDILGSFVDYTWDVSNEVQDGSGGGSFDEFPNAVGADFTITATRFIAASDTAIVQLTKMCSATAADRDVTCTLTIGGFVLSLPMTLSAVKHDIASGQLDKFTMTAKKAKGTISLTTVGSTTSLAYVAIKGDAIIAVVATTGPIAYSGTGIITKLSGKLADRQLTKMSGTIAMQGVLAIA